MNYDQEILKTLALAGKQGLKTEKIARHVFNSCNSMFSPLNYKEVHSYVSQYLIKCAKMPSSVIEKGNGHGIYRLNFKAAIAKHLLMKFIPHEEKNENEKSKEEYLMEDLSLSLFD